MIPFSSATLLSARYAILLPDTTPCSKLWQRSTAVFWGESRWLAPVIMAWRTSWEHLELLFLNFSEFLSCMGAAGGSNVPTPCSLCTDNGSSSPFPVLPFHWPSLPDTAYTVLWKPQILLLPTKANKDEADSSEGSFLAASLGENRRFCQGF